MSTSELSSPGTERPEDIEAVPVRRPGRWIASAIILIIAASIVRAIIVNPNFRWGVVGHYLFDPRILSGVRITIELTVISMAVGIVLGVVLSPSCACRPTRSCRASAGSTSGSSAARRCSSSSSSGSSAGRCSATSPSASRSAARRSSTSHTTRSSAPFMAAVLGFGLNEGAYMAEIVRAGIISVDEGQTEAAQSLGMSRLQTLRLIVIPQAMRVILPPTGNETISMLKNTSLVYRARVGLRSAVRHAADLRRHLPDDPAADRGQHLVPGDDQRALCRAVLHRATVSDGASPGPSR